jgi:hypothetical protein
VIDIHGKPSKVPDSTATYAEHKRQLPFLSLSSDNSAQRRLTSWTRKPHVDLLVTIPYQNLDQKHPLQPHKAKTHQEYEATELLSAFASATQKHLGNDQSKPRGVTISSSSLEALLSQSSVL